MPVLRSPVTWQADLHVMSLQGSRTECQAYATSITQLCLQDAWTPLHYAACNGHLSITETLLQHGAAANATEKVLMPSCKPVCKYVLSKHSFICISCNDYLAVCSNREYCVRLGCTACWTHQYKACLAINGYVGCEWLRLYHLIADWAHSSASGSTQWPHRGGGRPNQRSGCSGHD